jgi:hypothetical protein
LKFNFLPDDLIIKTKLQSGKYGFLIGGRFDLLPAIWSITDAPFFGNGSWGENCFYNLKLENFLFQNFYIIILVILKPIVLLKDIL